MVLVDHLVYVTPDVDRTIDDLEQVLGVRAGPGGRHPAWATRNAVIALGPRCYLEILGPDPAALEPPQPRPLGIDELSHARLATWCAPHDDLERFVHEAARHKVDLGAVEDRSRERDDGTTLSWRMTDLRKARADGVIPFFIDWGGSPHPAAGAPAGCTLRRPARRAPARGGSRAPARPPRRRAAGHDRRRPEARRRGDDAARHARAALTASRGVSRNRVAEAGVSPDGDRPRLRIHRTGSVASPGVFP